MKIIKNNFGTIVKLWINQAGAMLFGFFLLLPAESIASNYAQTWVLPFAGACAALFYLTLIFWVTCELGLHDSVPIEAGRMKFLWYKGTVIAAAANFVAIIAGVGQTVTKALITGVTYYGTHSHGRGFFATLHLIFYMINNVLHIMYRGLLQFFNLTNVPFIYLVIVLISVAVCTVGYIAGTRGFLANLLSKDARKRERM